jgi:hypothetical protein
VRAIRLIYEGWKDQLSCFYYRMSFHPHLNPLPGRERKKETMSDLHTYTVLRSALFRILPHLRYRHALREVGRSELWIPAFAGKTKGGAWHPGFAFPAVARRHAFREGPSGLPPSQGQGSAREGRRGEEFGSSCYLTYKLIDTLLGRTR